MIQIVKSDSSWSNLKSCLEEDAAAEELSEDAADGPHVDGVGVVLGAHEDLGRAVVLRHHLLRHGFVGVCLLHSGQSEITYLFNKWKNISNNYLKSIEFSIMATCGNFSLK